MRTLLHTGFMVIADAAPAVVAYATVLNATLPLIALVMQGTRKLGGRLQAT